MSCKLFHSWHTFATANINFSLIWTPKSPTTTQGLHVSGFSLCQAAMLYVWFSNPAAERHLTQLYLIVTTSLKKHFYTWLISVGAQYNLNIGVVQGGAVANTVASWQEGCGFSSDYGSSVWSWRVLPVTAWALSGYSSFLSQSKDM